MVNHWIGRREWRGRSHILEDEESPVATVDTAKSTPKSTHNSASTLNGAEILVEGLIREGTECIYAYPGGASMPLY